MSSHDKRPTAPETSQGYDCEPPLFYPSNAYIKSCSWCKGPFKTSTGAENFCQLCRHLPYFHGAIGDGRPSQRGGIGYHGFDNIGSDGIRRPSTQRTALDGFHGYDLDGNEHSLHENTPVTGHAGTSNSYESLPPQSVSSNGRNGYRTEPHVYGNQTWPAWTSTFNPWPRQVQRPNFATPPSLPMNPVPVSGPQLGRVPTYYDSRTRTFVASRRTIRSTRRLEMRTERVEPVDGGGSGRNGDTRNRQQDGNGTEGGGVPGQNDMTTR